MKPNRIFFFQMMSIFCSYCRTRYGRFYTSTVEFVNRHHLGNPEAGNFFLAQWDDYVPIIHSWLDEENSSRRRNVNRRRKTFTNNENNQI